MPSIAHPDDLRYMKRCLELASGGSGFTSPNPVVGAVIVHNNRIIGEGFHLKAGTPHAEVNAVSSVKDKSLLKESTIYVSLEPCSHFGKTPPCADLIISSGIQKVVAGTTDTTSKVAGKGFERMRNAGINVVVGVGEEECRKINERFFTFHEKKRPWIVLKWAESSDGFIDFKRKKGDLIGPNWITGITERVLVHRWRAREDAILVGGATIRTDDPGLDVRYWSGNNPIKVIVSKSGDISPDSRIFRAPAGKILLFTANRRINFPGVETILIPDNELPVKEIITALYDLGIQSVIIEGGATILRSFINNGLWDEARVFTGRKPFISGIKAPVIEGRIISSHEFADSSLRIFTGEQAETPIIC
jgi:diaminohydroxyphosphoribosylaminopyrimidine deaminase / 5-amino-6-(5-phosphoribosylamino)uracil reductase